MIALAAWRKQHGLEGGEVNVSSGVLEESLDTIGATVMGRNMFGGGPGPWGEHPWEGWWGDEPPFHTPVFVLTHHEREPLRKQGGTTFTFVTDGIESALEQAKEAAGGKDVSLGDFADVSRPLVVTAWSWGAGIARFITPTSAVVMAGIALAGVRYDKWIRFMLPLMGILFVASLVMLGIAAAIE